MNFKLRIILTNWINLIGIAGAIFIWEMITVLFLMNNAHDLPYAIFMGVLDGFWVLLYSSVFFLGFTCAIAVLDWLLIDLNKALLTLKMLFQWLIISTPFAWWAYQYKEWVFIVAIITFALTQMLRKRYIIAIICKAGVHVHAREHREQT